MQVLVTIIGQRKRFCISNKLPGEAAAPGLKLCFEGDCDKLGPKISVAGHAQCLPLTHRKPNRGWVPLLDLLLLAVQSVNCVQLSGTTQTAAHQASKSFTVSRNLLKFTSVESVMLPNLVILQASFSSCSLPYPASGSFPMSQLFSFRNFWPPKQEQKGMEVAAWLLNVSIQKQHMTHVRHMAPK